MRKSTNNKGEKAIESVWGKGSCCGCSRTKNYKGNDVGSKYSKPSKRK
jgi:hypothetical protein